MKSFIRWLVWPPIIIAVIGGVVLNSIQEPVDKAYTTSGVRPAPRARRQLIENRVGREADAGSRFDCCHILRKFEQSIGLRQ